METLKRKVEEQEKRLEELQAKLDGKGDSFTDKLVSIKDTIERGKMNSNTAEMDSIYASYVAGKPEVENQDHVVSLVDYSINFVEKNAPKMMNLLGVLAADSSPFKLQTCITLILLVLPPLVKVAVETLQVMINGFVHLKNKLREAALELVSPEPEIVTPKKKNKSLKRWLAGE